MKKVMKIMAVLIILLLTAALAAELLLQHLEESLPRPQEEPMMIVSVIGSITRNNSALSSYLSQDSILAPRGSTENHYLIAHYENTLPSSREKDLLKGAGISAVTLPYLSDEEIEFMVENEELSDEPNLKEKLSVLKLTQNQDFVLLNLPADLKTEQISDILGALADKKAVIIKFEHVTQTWSEELFDRNAKAAIDGGAHVVIGDHQSSPLQVQMYGEGVIIPSLSSFLGGRNTSGAMVTVAVYAAGVIVEVAPLQVERGVPALLKGSWHYFQAQAFLNRMVGDEFRRQPLKAFYASPALFKQGDGTDPEVAGEATQEINHNATYAVAAGHPLAVKAGIEILQAGGNAIDAAVGVAYALAVVEPDGSGLGGGGIMLIHLAAENRQIVIDYRETAPSTVSRDEIEKMMKWPSTGIPGFVSGLEKAIEAYGTLDYAAAIRPAFHLAKDGFVLTSQLHRKISNNSGKLARSPGAVRDFFRNGWPARVGEVITQPTLAKTLQSIMDQGSAVFYEGYISNSFIDVLKSQGVTLHKQDLKNYQPVVRVPLVGAYRNLTIVTVPPPAGGFNVLQQLKILNNFDLSAYAEPEPEVYRLLEQTMKTTYSDRRNYIGDPNFVHVELEELLSQGYVQEKVAQINEGRVPLQMFTDPYRPADNTTHFVVVDAAGNWVSVTNTLSYLFGNGLQAEGFFLNTQLNNFSTNPSSPNYFQPGKRPFSHISPMLVLNENSPILALGSPGGRRIPAYLTQVLVLLADFKLNIEDAIDYPRFWSEGKTIWVEAGMPREVTALFRRQGYEVVTWNPSSYFGRVAAIYYDLKTKKISGSGDPSRGEGIFKTQ